MWGDLHQTLWATVWELCVFILEIFSLRHLFIGIACSALQGICKFLCSIKLPTFWKFTFSVYTVSSQYSFTRSELPVRLVTLVRLVKLVKLVRLVRLWLDHFFVDNLSLRLSFLHVLRCMYASPISLVECHALPLRTAYLFPHIITTHVWMEKASLSLFCKTQV